MASSESVGTYPCLGGCGRSLNPERYPDGLCPDCDRGFAHAEPDPDVPTPGDPGYKRRSD